MYIYDDNTGNKKYVYIYIPYWLFLIGYSSLAIPYRLAAPMLASVRLVRLHLGTVRAI